MTPGRGSMTTTARAHKNPYVGPQSFRRGDGLYGRDREVADLLDLLIAERVVLLHSPSGAGKTSLIQARLLSLLEAGFEVLPVVRLDHGPRSLTHHDAGQPLHLSALLSLKKGVPSHLQRPLPELARPGLARYVAQWPDLDDRPGNGSWSSTSRGGDDRGPGGPRRQGRVLRGPRGHLARPGPLGAVLDAGGLLAELDPCARDVPTRFSTRFRLDLLTVEQALEQSGPAQEADVEFTSRRGEARRRPAAGAGAAGTRVVAELGRQWSRCSCRCPAGRYGRGSATPIGIAIDDIESTGDIDGPWGHNAASVAAVSRETEVAEQALRDSFEQELVSARAPTGRCSAAQRRQRRPTARCSSC